MKPRILAGTSCAACLALLIACASDQPTSYLPERSAGAQPPGRPSLLYADGTAVERSTTRPPDADAGATDGQLGGDGGIDGAAASWTALFRPSPLRPPPDAGSPPQVRPVHGCDDAKVALRREWNCPKVDGCFPRGPATSLGSGEFEVGGCGLVVTYACRTEDGGSVCFNKNNDVVFESKCEAAIEQGRRDLRCPQMWPYCRVQTHSSAELVLPPHPIMVYGCDKEVDYLCDRNGGPGSIFGYRCKGSTPTASPTPQGE